MISPTPGARVLAGDGRRELDIRITLDGVHPAPSDPQQRQLLERAISELRAQTEAAGRSFFDGPVVRMSGYEAAPEGVHVTAQRSGYFCFAAGVRLRAAGAFTAAADGFDHPLVCAALGTETVIVTSDERIMTARRQGTAVQDGLVLVGVGEMMDPDKDLVDGQLSTRRCMTRSVLEELGVDVTGVHATPLALVCDFTGADAGMVGYMDVPFTSRELEQAAQAAADGWENTDLQWVPCEPKHLRELRDQPLSWSSPAALAFFVRHRFGNAGLRTLLSQRPSASSMACW